FHADFALLEGPALELDRLAVLYHRGEHNLCSVVLLGGEAFADQDGSRGNRQAVTDQDVGRELRRGGGQGCTRDDRLRQDGRDPRADIDDEWRWLRRGRGRRVGGGLGRDGRLSRCHVRATPLAGGAARGRFLVAGDQALTRERGNGVSRRRGRRQRCWRARRQVLGTGTQPCAACRDHGGAIERDGPFPLDLASSHDGEQRERG